MKWYEGLDSGVGEKIEGDAAVDAAVAEMPVERSDEPVLVEQLAEVAQVVADFRGVNRGILPSRPGERQYPAHLRSPRAPIPVFPRSSSPPRGR